MPFFFTIFITFAKENSQTNEFTHKKGTLYDIDTMDFRFYRRT